MTSATTQQRPGPAYRRQPAQKREALMAAARELFSANGYEETPTVKIAERAGVSEGILFHHFGSKRKLFDKLAEEYGQQCAEASMPEESAEWPTERTVRAAFDFADRDRNLYRLFAVAGPKLERAPAGLVGVEPVSVAGVADVRPHVAEDRDQLVTADLDLDVIDETRKIWQFYRDRRPETYGELTELLP